MTTTKAQAKALAIGETLAYQTPDARFVIRMQRTHHTWTVTTERGGFRIDELSRTFAAEHSARDLARDISTRLRDGATVAEVVEAIQPAAELITAVTAHLALAAAADGLSPAARRAILAAVDGHVARGQVATVKTLYALANTGRLGDLTRTDGRRQQVTGLRLNQRGRQMRAYLIANHTHQIAA